MFETWGKFRVMKRPAKKKNTSKTAAKKPASGRASKKPATKAAPVKAQRPASSPSRERAEPYMPKPISGVGWPAFRYPLS
jgi:hypothetical protein